MSIVLATAMVVLTPVSLDDPVLVQSDTFLSEITSDAIAQGTAEILYCLDLPEGHPDGSRACLTQDEWQAVFDTISHERSVQARERAMQITHWYNGVQY